MPIVFRCEQCGRRYRVADDKVGQHGKCKDCGAAIVVPAPVEESPGGSRIYRHQPRERDFEMAIGDSEAIEAISDHIERHVGEVAGVFHELLSDLVHVDVHMVEATRERPIHTLITSGMSDRPMIVPPEAAELEYAELMIYLPPEWPLTQEAFEDEANYWPVRLLKTLARLPHEYDTWLGEGHTVPNGDPPEPYADNTKLVCALLTPPILEEEDFWLLETSPEKIIRFYAIVPLYQEEMDFKLRKGTDALLDRFQQQDVSPVVDVARPNVCRKRFGLF